MTRVLLFVVAFVQGLSNVALADESHVSTRLLCADDAAIFQVARSFNDPPVFGPLPLEYAEAFADAVEQPDLECDLGGGGNRSRPLRVKVGTYGGVHFGACGGATKHFLSMWIDKRRILSRLVFDSPCDLFRNLDLIHLTDASIVFCARTNGWLRPQGSAPDVRPEADLACIDVTDILSGAFMQPIDDIEYPPQGGPRLEGQVILIRSEDDELCGYLHREFSKGRSFYTVFDRHWRETGTKPLDWSLGPMGNFGPFPIDINNDGHQDTVAVQHYGPGSIGERLVLVADGKDKQGSSSLPEPLSPRDLVGFPVLVPVEETVFGEGHGGLDVPYVLVHPFEWEKAIFVLFASVYDFSPPEWAVFRVNPDNGFSEICVLDQIPIHY